MQRFIARLIQNLLLFSFFFQFFVDLTYHRLKKKQPSLVGKVKLHATMVTYHLAEYSLFVRNLLHNPN
jgi:hypothetical protein